MDNLTKGTEEVVENVVEEVVAKVNLGTVLTGVCAATGVLAIGYGAYRGIKWVADKVKTAKENRVTELEDEEAYDSEDGVEEE